MELEEFTREMIDSIRDKAKYECIGIWWEKFHLMDDTGEDLGTICGLYRDLLQMLFKCEKLPNGEFKVDENFIELRNRVFKCKNGENRYRHIFMDAPETYYEHCYDD